ncbi:MAG TPA: HAD-IC family P-type ATPase [Clostridiales bacterium]|nr:HAD-IC family P-type ATPase [Clostridiales bacterium]HQK73440.1 HAD-IC family P-type ATPase [Clostridiales bacterium]
MKAARQQENSAVPLPPRVKALPSTGLSAAQVRERLDAGLDNRAVESPTKTVGQIIRGNILTYFNLIFFVLALALVAVGSFKNLTFMVVVVINTLIGIVQELNAKRTLDKLTLLSEPKAAVVRDEMVMRVPVNRTVRDDIAVFAAGNQIYADAVVLDGSVQVNESLMTGEQDEITKKAGDELISGSFVVAGECRARLEKVGADSHVSRLTLEAKKDKKRKRSGMMKALTRLLQVIGVALIPVGTLMYIQQTRLLGLLPKQGVENTTAALIGMIPEGLYLLVSIALAVSVVRLSKKKTLVHDLGCIETLARVDVLCVDKTGTITGSDMEVTGLLPLADIEGGKEALERLLADFAANMPGTNATMRAVKARFDSGAARRAQAVKEFTSTDKYSAASFGGDEHYALGAPEFVMRGRYGEIQGQVDPLAAAGSRVLLFALCGPLGEGEELSYVKPLALVAIDNPVRPAAKATFEYFRQQGVAVKVISGDNPATVGAAAAAAGIEGASDSVDASTLENEEQLADAAQRFTVFGRVKPDQKRQLIRALQKAGHTVAMTGDGVNDVLALKAADCSIAMASGSEVASQVSHLVMLNSDFDAMPHVVAEGRRVINNIERSASLFLVKNIFSFILAVIAISAVFEYPLTPNQLSLMSTLTIGIPSFFLALEPNKERVRGRFLLNVVYRALPAALTDLVIVVGVVLFDAAFSIEAGQLKTVAALLITFVGLIMVWRVCRPFNTRRVVLFAGLLALLAGILIVVPRLFALEWLSFGTFLILGVFMLLIPSVMYAFTLGLNKLVAFAAFLKRKWKLLKEDGK